MALLKDSEREQLRQLVKACLLEISKLKIELRKCQKQTNLTQKKNFQKREKELLEEAKEKDNQIKVLEKRLDQYSQRIEELEEIEKYFRAITAKPKKDLTSFQSQLYELLPEGKDTAENLYEFITQVAFSELTRDNFEHALRNLERKGYFMSEEVDGVTQWRKLDKNY